MKNNLNIAYLNGAEGVTRKSSTSVGGYCIPIVDSEDKLESLGLAQGQIAAVAVDTIETKSFSELYQPIGNVENPTDFDKWERVSGISVNIPEEMQAEESSMIAIAPTSMLENRSLPLFFCVESFYDDNDEIIYDVYARDLTTGRFYDLVHKNTTSGEVYWYPENIEYFNSLFANGEYVFGGMNGEYSTLDKGIKILVDGERYSNLYINNGSYFEPFALEYSIQKLRNDLPRTGYPTNWVYVTSDYKQILLNPNEYNILQIQNNTSIDIRLDWNEGNYNIEEFIIEIKCDRYDVQVSFPSYVKFPDGVTPSFEKNSTVVISIVNGLAVFKEFV